MQEVWDRLSRGLPLDDLGLPVVNGRLDLSGVVAPDPSVARSYSTASASVTEFANMAVIEGARWRGLDLSRGQLRGLRFHDSEIEDCCFDEANCSDWRLWGTTIRNSSFRAADLRKAVLGGVKDGRRNAFNGLDFTKADLRQTVYVSTDMKGCRFVHTKLARVDFQGTVFQDCVFEGKLEEVQFHRLAFRGEAFPPNEMKGVDLRRAKFRDVEFRGLDLNDVRWPEGADHFVVQDYPATLDRLLAAWQSRTDVAAKRLGASFRIARKWVGPKQSVGVVSKADLIEAGGEEAVADFLRLVGDKLTSSRAGITP